MNDMEFHVVDTSDDLQEGERFAAARGGLPLPEGGLPGLTFPQVPAHLPPKCQLTFPQVTAHLPHQITQHFVCAHALQQRLA